MGTTEWTSVTDSHKTLRNLPPLIRESDFSNPNLSRLTSINVDYRASLRISSYSLECLNGSSNLPIWVVIRHTTTLQLRIATVYEGNLGTIQKQRSGT